MSGGNGSKELENRLEAVGWGLILLLIAALALPNGNAEYVSVAAVGAAMLLLNMVRKARGIAVAWFSAILGTSMLAGGTAAVFGLKMDVFVVFFALAGAVVIAGAVVGRRDVSRTSAAQAD
jgi:hypothetical protein